MLIDKRWLIDKNASNSIINWFSYNYKYSENLLKVIDDLIKINKLHESNWFIIKSMRRRQCLKYSIFASEKVIGIYENKYPNDFRLREAIKFSKATLIDDKKENRLMVRKYAHIAHSIAHTCYAETDYDTANSAYVAHSCAHTAHAFVGDSYSDVDSITHVIHALFYAFRAINDKNDKLEILHNGINILLK